MIPGVPDEMLAVARQMADAALARLRYWYKSDGRDCERLNRLIEKLCRASIEGEESEFRTYCQRIDGAFRPSHTEVEAAEMMARMDDPELRDRLKKLSAEVMDDHEQEHRHGP